MWRLWRLRLLMVMVCRWWLQSGSWTAACPRLQVLQGAERRVVWTASRVVVQM
jgi:hypothetical protein